MKKALPFISVLVWGLALLLLSTPVPTVAGAATRVIEQSRTHTAAGWFGCPVLAPVTAVSTANPGIIVCTAAHGLKDADPIQVTGVVGATQANVQGYAKVTGQSASSFALYSDAALTTGVNVTGTYSSGGVVSEAVDISDWVDADGHVKDWTLHVKLEKLTAAKNLLLAVQSSVDGFASDVRTIAVFSTAGAYGAPYPTQEWTVRGREVPMARFGISNARIRVAVQGIDAGTSVTLSAWVE